MVEINRTVQSLVGADAARRANKEIERTAPLISLLGVARRERPNTVSDSSNQPCPLKLEAFSPRPSRST